MSKTKVISIFDKFFIHIAAFYGFLWLHPFFTWENSVIRYFGTLYLIVFVLWVLITNFKMSRLNVFYSFIAFFLILMFSFRDGNVIRNIIIYSISLLPIVLIGNKDRYRIYDRFVLIVSLSLLPAVIIAILLLIGIDLNWSQLSSNSWTKPYYRNYFNLAIYPAYGGVSQEYFLSWGGSIDRISGMFDEPGVVGTVCGLILISRNFSLRRLDERIILLAGIFSFSFAFYLMVLGYYLVKHFRYAPLILMAFILLMQFSSKDSYIYTKILYRFEFTDNGLQGNNRTNDGFDRLYSEFLQKDNIFLGIKQEEFIYRAKIYGSEALSWKTFVVVNGFLLIIMHTIYFMGYASTLKNKSVWIFCAFYFFSIYQRPYDFSLGYWLIFFGGLLAFRYTFDKKINYSSKDFISSPS